jgi:hypothetical protein
MLVGTGNILTWKTAIGVDDFVLWRLQIFKLNPFGFVWKTELLEND